uniref:NADH dehydrogenase [ubiquinone] 1 beta subcomplex subunit 7 n=1 Tax=Strix occidentalis caurina TaxID=311401 RepID=A0A8D0F816_STROC
MSPLAHPRHVPGPPIPDVSPRVPACPPMCHMGADVPVVATPLMVATAEELARAQVPLEQRDFCAHHLLRLMRCHRDAFPVPWRCHDLRHAWDACQHHEYRGDTAGGTRGRGDTQGQWDVG